MTVFLIRAESIVEIGVVELCLNAERIEIIFKLFLKEDILNTKHRVEWIVCNSDLKPEYVRNSPIVSKILLVCKRYLMFIFIWNNWAIVSRICCGNKLPFSFCLLSLPTSSSLLFVVRKPGAHAPSPRFLCN